MKMRITALIMGAVLLPATSMAQERARIAPVDAPAELRMTEAAEPGTALRITGIVVDEAGRPLPGASLYVYQTDARGWYAPDDAGANRRARIHGWVRTDAAGRFEIRTVRPGSYPNTRIPQHVHFIANAGGKRERVFEIVFDDDPNVDERVRTQAARAESIYALCKP